MKNINRTAAAAAVMGSIAVAAIGLGAGTASADTDSGPRCFWGNTAIANHDSVTGYIAFPATIYDDENRISILGSHKLTETPTGYTASVLGQRIALTDDGEGGYRVAGPSPVVRLVPCGDEVYGEQ